jgi:hypothetical protein
MMMAGGSSKPLYKGKMVRPARVELATFWFVAKRSIQLSYGRPSMQMRFR